MKRVDRDTRGCHDTEVADERIRSDCRALLSIGDVHVGFVRDAGSGSGLKRWHLIESPWFSISLNRLSRPAYDGPPHSHVRPILSIPVRRGYIERRTDPVSGAETERRRRPGVPYLIGTDVFHHTADAPDGPCWTIALYGPTSRSTFRFLLPSGRIVDQVSFSEMIAT